MSIQLDYLWKLINNDDVTASEFESVLEEIEVED
jgi:hypothetical protein